MSNSAKSQVTNFFTIFALVLAAFQGMIPTMTWVSAGTLTLVSAIVMFLVSGTTIWKQILSNEIDSAAATPTIILAVIATLGAINELTNAVHIGAAASQWIRFGITAGTTILNLVSKIFWPTDDTKSTL